MLQVNYHEIEERARATGATMQDVLQRAGITHQTWLNWRQGRIDPFDRINKVIKAVEDIEREAQ